MTWTGAVTAIEAHMVTASSEAHQRAGEPGVPVKHTAAWYYVGSADNELIGETLTDHPFGDNIEVRFYWPVADRAAVPSRSLEMTVRQTARAFIAAIEADRSLGENCEVATPGDAEAGWLDLGGAAWRIVTIPVSIGFTDLEPIAR
jgi:hypothetical protein